MQFIWANRHRSWTIPALMIVLWNHQGPAEGALSVVHLSSDEVAAGVISQVAVVVGGQIGDGVEQTVGGSDNRTFELALGSSPGAPAGVANLSWDNGPAAAPFLLTYDAGRNSVTLSVGLQVLTYQPTNGFTDVFIRARAARADLSTAVFVENLLLDGVPLGSGATVPWPGPGLDILWLAGADLNRGFAMAGTIVLCWVPATTLDDPMPQDDDLAFQVTLATASGCVAGTQCDDGDACTGDTCTDGQCVHAPIPNCQLCGSEGGCDDGDPCTADTCGSAGTCDFAPLSGCTRCTTPAACTIPDACSTPQCSPAGVCGSAPIAGCVLCSSDEECGDTDSCTTDFCYAGTCHHPARQSCEAGCFPVAETTCTDGVDDDCDGHIDCADPDCDLDPVCGAPHSTEVCGDCVDNDGDGLVDFEDPDCCAEPGDLVIRRLRMRPTHKRRPIKPWIQVAARSSAISSSHFLPSAADTTLQVRDASGELFCRTIEAPFWQHRPRHSARFKDKKGRLKGGVRLGRWRLHPEGETLFRMRGRGFPLRPLDGSAVQITVRLGDQCVRTLSHVQKRPSGTLAFP